MVIMPDADLEMALTAANNYTSTRNIGSLGSNSNNNGTSLDVNSSNSNRLQQHNGGRFFDGHEWESAIKEIESHGQWIECRTTLTGRVMWYNTNSFRIVFDRPPELEAYMEEIEKNKEKFVANKQNELLPSFSIIF